MARDYSWTTEALCAYNSHKFPTPNKGLPDEMFILNATPGSGKTRCCLKMLMDDLSSGEIEKFIIQAPTVHICDQWQTAAFEHFRMDVLRNVDWDNPDILPNYKGIVITYAAMFNNSTWLKRFCNLYKCAIVFDEFHYLGETLGWGNAALAAFGLTKKKIALTGTLWRHDECPLPWTESSEDGLVKAHYTYSYARALIDEINRHLSFPTIDAEVQWEAYNRVKKRLLSGPLSNWEAELALRTALKIPDWEPRIKNAALCECWVYKMIEASVKKLNELCSQPEYSNTAALFVAVDIAHAKQIAQLLIDFFNIDAEIVHSKEGDAKDRLRKFKSSDRKALVAVDMVTEGVDIQRLRILGWASNKTTELKIEQILGRIKRPEFDGDNHGYVFWPQVEPFKSKAAKILEQCSIVRKEKLDLSKKPFDSTSIPRNFKAISSRGLDGHTYYSGYAYTPDEMEFAADHRNKNPKPWARKMTLEEYAEFIRDNIKPDFGRVPDAEVNSSSPDVNSGFGEFNIKDLFDSVPLESRIKRAKNLCQEKVKQLVGKILQPGEDFSTKAKIIHQQWASMPGNHWQSNPMITEEELKRKAEWLDNLINEV